jgi:asparagine synthase (glutamine-hydrolysing)
VRTARKLARMCGQGHEVIRIDEGFFEEFPRLARDSVYVSDGTHDAFGAHDVYFNKVAHDVAPIRLTGKFGSEVVRTRRLIRRGDFPRDLVQPGFRPFLDEVPSLDEISGRRHPLSRVVCEEIPWYEFGRVAIEQSKVILRTPYMDNEIVKLMFQAPAGLRASRDLQVRYVKEKRYELSALLTNLGRIGSDGEVVSKLVYIPFWLLFKAEYMYLYAMPHWLTRLERRFEGMRPERVLAGRQKFEAYRIWIRRELADFVRQTLLNPGAHCTEFFDKAALARVTTRHIAGTHNYLSEINKMLTLELMCSSLLEG